MKRAVIAAWRSGISSKSWLNNFQIEDADEVVSCIFDPTRVDVVVVNDTFLLAFILSEPWYLKRKILVEELTLRLYRNPVPFSVITDALDWIAKKENATGICSGTVLSSDEDSLSRKYLNAGYLPDGVRFYKPV